MSSHRHERVVRVARHRARATSGSPPRAPDVIESSTRIRHGVGIVRFAIRGLQVAVASALPVGARVFEVRAGSVTDLLAAWRRIRR